MMPCCGSWQRATSHPAAPTKAAAGPVLFEYRGPGPLTIFGRVTGRRYHFPGTSARAAVDPRDAPLLEIIRGLERVG
jgi:hypothetical protein